MASRTASVPRIFFTAIALITAIGGPANAGTPRSPAFEHYYQLAVRGDPEAQANLAASYARGDGVAQSDAHAFQWCLRAAGQGHGEAQLMLSGLFANAKGAPRDYVTAYKWASIAAAHSREPEILERAVNMIRALATQLSGDEIDAARARAAAWQPRYEMVRADPTPAAERAVHGIPSAGGGVRNRWTRSHVRTARAMAYPADAGTIRLKSCRCQVPARLLRLARRWGL
jgi:TPR repeat protein